MTSSHLSPVGPHLSTVVLSVLKVVAVVIVLAVVIVVCASLLLNSKAVQNRIMKRATQMLAEKLDTHVAIDSVYVDFMGQCVHLYGLAIDDREQREMLRAKELSADVKMLPLFRKRVVIGQASLSGVEALLLKPSSEDPANYQFVIDAFRKDTTAMRSDTVARKPGQQLSLDVSRLQLKDIHTRYNNIDVSLREALYTKAWMGSESTVRIDSLHFVTDNHLPRKNTGKPHRGFFDPGHLDITASLLLNIAHVGKDTLAAELMACQVADAVTGIDIKGLHSKIHVSKRDAHLSDLSVRQGTTLLHVPEADILLPDRETGRKLSYRADSVSGRAVLKDISRPFAPVLKDFTLPLNLSVALSGTDSTMLFNNVRVSTEDKRLQIKAKGRINHLKKGRDLAIHFDVEQMTARQGVKSKIIGQFPVKKLMMKQLHRLGDIAYRGSFDVVWKKETFRGVLNTVGGRLDFHFTLDGQTKFLSGGVKSKGFRLGHVMDMASLGDVTCKANFSIDISKPRTAAMRRRLGGKLPIGKVDAEVEDCSYKGIHVRNLTANIHSNGAEATGDLTQQGKYRDLFCSFSFTNTDEMHKMRVFHPRVKFHKRQDTPTEDKEKKPKKGGFLKNLFSKKKSTDN